MLTGIVLSALSLFFYLYILSSVRKDVSRSMKLLGLLLIPCVMHQIADVFNFYFYFYHSTVDDPALYICRMLASAISVMLCMLLFSEKIPASMRREYPEKIFISIKQVIEMLGKNKEKFVRVKDVISEMEFSQIRDKNGTYVNIPELVRRLEKSPPYQHRDAITSILNQAIIQDSPGIDLISRWRNK